MKQRRGQYVFALVIGLAFAVFSYRWITNPDPRAERLEQESVVHASRVLLADVVSNANPEDSNLEIVDPLATNRKVGKVYVYREADGWAVSGYYRRNETDKWHPFLAKLDAELALASLKVGDPALMVAAQSDPRLEASP